MLNNAQPLTTTNLLTFVCVFIEKMSVYVAFTAVALAVSAYFGHQLWLSQTGPTMAERVGREIKLNEEFVRHSEHFSRKEIVKVKNFSL